MPISLRQFTDNLIASWLFTADELAAFKESLPPDRRPHDPKGLARELIRAGKLTKYQAAQIYQGKTGGLVLGEYVVLDLIGEGGMGQVFKAWHRTMDRVVALKVISGKRMQSEQAVERFHREVKTAARLVHPNIVTAFDAGEAEGTHFLVMEYVDGSDLAALLAEQGPLPVQEAIHCILQAARGLEYAHRQGVVHRDIKPGNLLLDREGVVKILDMGLARLDRPADPYAPTGTEQLTASGQVMGTYHYMAPEQAADTHGADHRADIYSLGCTLYRLLTAQNPYEGETPVQILFAHRDAPIPPLGQARPDVPEALDAVYQKMLAKWPADRYQSMGEVAAALEACLRGELPAAGEAPSGSSSSSDSALKRFLQSMAARPAVAVPQAQVAVEETLAYPQTPQTETATEGRRAPKPRRHPAPLVAVGISAAVMLLILGSLMLLTRSGSEPKRPPPAARQRIRDTDVGQTDVGQAPPDISHRTADTTRSVRQAQPDLHPWQQPWDETDAKAKALLLEQRFGEAEALYRELNERFEHVQLNRKIADAVAAVQEQATAAFQQIEAQARQHLVEHKFADARAVLSPVIQKHGIPASIEAAQKLLVEIDAAEAQWMAESARQAQIDKQQQLQRRYTEAMKPVEDLVAAWDFRSASAALAKVHFEEEELAARAAAWRDGVERLEDLKARIIAKINAADPRLKKSDLLIRGTGGQIVQAHEQGIQTKLITGKTESLPWSDVGPRAVDKLIALASTPEASDARLAAGILSLASGDPISGEKHFERAQSLGADTAPYLGPVAAAVFAHASELLAAGQSLFQKGQFPAAKKQLTEAEKVLAKLEEKYAEIPWLTTNKAAFDAVRQTVQHGTHEAEAEILFAEAAELFAKEQLFDVKPVVETLTTDYADSKLITDATRKPSFTQMQQAVADLGQFITVRLDGQGDFTNVQKAIDAALPNSLIEIQDHGPYAGRISIWGKPGLTLRGADGCWPIITSAGIDSPVSVSLSIGAEDISLERLVIAHVHAPPGGGDCIHVNPSRGTRLSIESCVLLGGRALLLGRSCVVESSFCHSSISAEGPCVVRDSVCFGFRRVPEGSRLQNVVCFSDVEIGARCNAHYCTFTDKVMLGTEAQLVDSIMPSVQSWETDAVIRHCNVHGSSPFIDSAKPGEGCFGGNPQFRDPANLDYRLMPTSPCIGKASDGGDIGCRYTPEMIEMCKIALELRRQGIIKF